MVYQCDRLEIRNAGYSLKPLNSLEEINQPGSFTRNEAIATILHELNLAENKGTGGRAMIEAMLEANLSLPRFDSQREKDYFCLTLWTHHLVGKEETQWLAQFKDFDLSNDEARALIIVKKTGQIDNFTYRVIFPLFRSHKSRLHHHQDSLQYNSQMTQLLRRYQNPPLLTNLER